MTELSKKIFTEYQVRKTADQKTRFIELLQESFPALQIESTGIFKSRNLIYGNIKEAKILLTAHYDTCAKMIVPNFITPKKPVLSILYSFILVMPLAVIVLIMNILLSQVTDSFAIHYILSVIVFVALMYLTVAGPANKQTANDNTSGVILLCELIETLTEEEFKNIAIVFFDHEELGLLGSTSFRKKYKEEMANKLLINFDCISDGDYILAAVSKEARKNYGERINETFKSKNNKEILITQSEKTYYPSDQAGFTNHIAVAALRYHEKLGYYMTRIHTKKDTIMDETNLITLIDCIKEFIHNF